MQTNLLGKKATVLKTSRDVEIVGVTFDGVHGWLLLVLDTERGSLSSVNFGELLVGEVV